eukprot:2451810-Pyramimonas_sp.AAC.1
MADHRLLLTHFERKRYAGHHQHASVCNTKLSMAAHQTSRMQSLFVDAVQIARDLCPVNRDPLFGHPFSSIVLVTHARGFDLDDPTSPWQPDGSITRPPVGGLGCLACADNVNVHSPSYDRNPKHCRWHDKED